MEVEMADPPGLGQLSPKRGLELKRFKPRGKK